MDLTDLHKQRCFDAASGHVQRIHNCVHHVCAIVHMFNQMHLLMMKMSRMPWVQFPQGAFCFATRYDGRKDSKIIFFSSRRCFFVSRSERDLFVLHFAFSVILRLAKSCDSNCLHCIGICDSSDCIAKSPSLPCRASWNLRAHMMMRVM